MSLTNKEHKAMSLTAELANALAEIVGDSEATRQSDLEELIHPLHQIQRSIMAQSAAREHPNFYRLLGGPPVTK